MRAGRPVRFLVAVLGGWAGLRVLVLWPAPGGVVIAPRIAGRAVAGTITHRPGPRVAARPERPEVRAPRAPGARVRSVAEERDVPVVPRSWTLPARAGAPVNSTELPVVAAAQDRATIVPVPPVPPRPGGRLTGSAWLIARGDGTGGGLGASQLGGSQAGARLAYALGDARPVALVGRVVTPLERRGREAALGIEWALPAAPVRLVVERRFGLDRGARGGWSAGAIGGVYRQVGRDFRIEAYGQAGVIGRDGIEAFADGAARFTRDLGSVGPAAFDLGTGAWGGAQRGAERLDLGPTAGLSAPVAGRRVRLTVDYRVRVAGDARPGSGPALSLGTDF